VGNSFLLVVGNDSSDTTGFTRNFSNTVIQNKGKFHEIPRFHIWKRTIVKKNEPFTVYPIKNLRLWPWNVGFDHVRMGLDQNVLWALRPPETTRENTDWVLQNDEMSWVIAFVWTCVDWWSVVSCFWHLAEHDRFVLEGRASVSATKKRMCWDWWHLWAWAGAVCPNWTSIYIERSGQVS